MISAAQIGEAARVLRAGGLVVFPTETVYGLGANALDAAAVDRIYEVKGRPANSPLIVHVASVDMAGELVADWPDTAAALAREFWPGPLTLVLPKSAKVPDRVTAGLPTVAIRLPRHPVARRLIECAGLPIAAPSANPFARLSPTTAAHVREMLAGKADMILDAGPAEVGIESTVLSLAGGKAVLLRPGMVSQQEIERVTGPVTAGGEVVGGHPSPGMHERHYSPCTPLVVVAAGQAPPGRVAYLWWSRPADAARAVRMPVSAAAYGAEFYRVLHELDREGWDLIAVETLPEGPEWAGIADRLRRAAQR
ncbi:MAG: threonylcarbamoyl-AMP synthase [Acidobacteria bacterium]|nr:threonylcarbamoyl-AMP synthase [Acidobacteriota bacterium]